MSEPNRRSLPSIRSQIALLVLACALPTVVSFGAVVRQFYLRERDTLMEDTQQSARMVAAAIDRDLVQSESAALALASSPSVRTNDLNDLHLQAGALLSPQFPASQFLLSEIGGKAVMHVGTPMPDLLNPTNNRHRLAAMFVSGRPQLSVVYVEGSALLAIDVPVFIDSRVAYALTALLKPDRLARILQDESISPHQAMTLYDGDGVIVAQSGGPRLLLGQPASPALRAQLLGSREALLSTEDAAGTPVYMGFSRSPVSGATVAIATPRAKALEGLLAAVTTISLALALVLLAGFSLAWMVGGRVARSIRDLVGPAQALAAGTPFTLPDMSFSEADAVARAFRALEGDLQRHRHDLEKLVVERTGQLEKSRAQLETLYATAPVGLSYVDNELRYIRINDYLAALNQQPAIAHLGRNVADMIADDHVRRSVLADYRTVLTTARPLTNQERSGYTAASPDQLHHWVVSYYPQFGTDGKIIAITGLVLDVTEHKRVQAELQRSRQLISSVVENIPAMIFLKGAGDLRYQMLNRYGAALYGHSNGNDFIGKSDFDFMPAEEAEFFVAADRRALAAGDQEVIELAEHPMVDAHGVTRYLSRRKVALRDAHGVPTHVLGVAFDITDRKHAEEVLRATTTQLVKSEHFVRTVTDNLPGMMAYWDAGLRCRFVNRYFLEWHGGSAEQVLGARLQDVVDAAGYAEALPYLSATLAGQPQGYASVLTWPDGHMRHVWLNFIPDYDDAGSVQGLFALVSDITALKESELHLQEVNEELIVARDRAEAASRAKSEFLANMSHEIRTPMNAIIGLARLLAEAHLEPRERGYLYKIQIATESLLSLVNDVLDFSRVEAGQLELEHTDFNLQRILDSIGVLVGGSAWDKGVELVYDIAPDLPMAVAGDPRRLQQVLLNLIGNAIKFTEQGEVILSVRPAGGPLRPGDSALLVEFRVRDTGIGIPAAQHDSIFGAFSQADNSTSRKYGGAGLGLAICRQLADMMGGAVTVASEPGRGSEFLFSCPLALGAAGAPPDLVGQAARGQPLSVLIVDDSASARAALAEACHSFGWQADSADGAEAARALLQQRARLAQHYDLMLLDRDMPEVDGPTMLQQIHASMSLALPPVLMMTSEHVAATLAQQAGSLGLAGILPKPVSPARLLQRVGALLAGEPPDSAPAAGPTPLQGRLAGMRVLLVEDNEINQEVAQYILLHAGATVALAANGALAVERMRAAPDGYDVVLMDIQMPVMNGYEAARAIRDDGLRALPIIAMTANVLDDDLRRASEAGMNAHVAKPIDVEELIAVLTRLVPLDGADSGGDGGPAGWHGAVAGEAGGAPSHHQRAALPGIELDTALARLGGNYEALVALLKRFTLSQGGSVAEVRALLAAGQRQQAGQLLHRLRGVAANLGAGDVARLTASSEAALHQPGGEAALRVSLTRLEQALAVVGDAVRGISAPQEDMPDGSAASESVSQKLAELQSLLQNNNLRALEQFQALRPALATAAQAHALAEAVETLNFTAAYQIVDDMLHRKESA